MKPLHGLVVCGGLSARMGEDKSMIVYCQKPQWQQVFEMLEMLCQTVSISCNKNQVSNYPADFPILVDDEAYQEIGPMGGLLTALKKYPTDSFLAVGCDYPMVAPKDLKQLTSARNPGAEAVCFCHSDGKVLEPLLAIYEPGILPTLKAYFSNSNFSLQQVLQQSATHRVTLKDSSILISANTPAQVHSIRMAMEASSNLSFDK